ncbi:MAG: DUF3710 domain-containing protein [Nocardioidaceae bacterium]
MRFRRRTSDDAQAPEELDAAPAVAGPRHDGPWDVSEVRLEEDDPARIDLGGLIVTGRAGLELQLQVDQASGEVAGVVLAGEESALELRAFAAPRNGDIWADVRRGIAAEVAQHGGTADETEGRWGPELRVVMPVTLPDGRSAQQPSRVVGITGPRWLLRATMFGRAAVEPADDGDVESALRDVVVVRGSHALPPGDPLPMRIPENLQPVDEE